MVDIKANNMDDIYRHICSQIMTQGREVRGTRELNNFSFELTDLSNNIINIRNISKAYLCAELTWYMLARNDVDFINPFAGMWGRISDDGVTSYSAYGDIVFKRHGFNQVDKIIELLATDRDSRRAVINFNVPNPNVIETKDEICTIALQFYIRDEKLHATGVMRSNDIWYGLPYDVAFFTELQKYIAHRLGIDTGSYTHHVISLHCYERNYDDMITVVNTIAKEKISIDIEQLDKMKRVIEARLSELPEDKEVKKDFIVELCIALKILHIKDLEAEALAYTE